MLKTLTIIAAAAAASAALPATTFAQMENGAGGDSMSKGSMGGMQSKSSMMKKSKKMHGHGMRHGMMKKPMSSGGM